MTIKDCTCKGINPNCEKCFGRGYYDDEATGIDINTFTLAKTFEREKHEKDSNSRPGRVINNEELQSNIERLFEELRKDISIIKRITALEKIKYKNISKKKLHKRKGALSNDKHLYFSKVNSLKNELESILEANPNCAQYISIKLKELEQKLIVP